MAQVTQVDEWLAADTRVEIKLLNAYDMSFHWVGGYTVPVPRDRRGVDVRAVDGKTFRVLWSDVRVAEARP